MEYTGASARYMRTRKAEVDMGAKIVLTGQARDIQKTEQAISFTIVTGPVIRRPPRGLRLFDPVHYRIECTTRQWQRAREDPNDQSDLLVEGYIEPRRDADTGQVYVAVVATVLQSMAVQNRARLQQLEEALEDARAAFQRARESQMPKAELEARAAAFVQANAGRNEFLERHPELQAGGRSE
jgi:hypothetical protein